MPVSVNDLDMNWLTYLEALRKIVDKINEVIGVVNNFNGYAEDVSDKVSIIQIDKQDVNDGYLYVYTIQVTSTLQNSGSYDFWLYNDSQGILVPVVNKIDHDDTLEWVDSSNYDVDESEFLDDCMIYARRVIK